jgi:hypothetical protein
MKNIFEEGSALAIAYEIGSLSGKLELSEQNEKLWGQPLIAKKKRDEYANKIEGLKVQLQAKKRKAA